MALIKCPECGKDVDSENNFCNYCGAMLNDPNEEKMDEKALNTSLSVKQTNKSARVKICLISVIIGLLITVVILFVLVLVAHTGTRENSQSVISSESVAVSEEAAANTTERPVDITPMVESGTSLEEQKLIGRWVSNTLVSDSGLTTDTEGSCYMIFDSDHTCVLSIAGDITNLSWKYFKTEDCMIYYSIEADGHPVVIALDEDPTDTSFYSNLILSFDDTTGIIFEKLP